MICTKHTQAEFTEMEKLRYFCEYNKWTFSRRASTFFFL